MALVGAGSSLEGRPARRRAVRRQGGVVSRTAAQRRRRNRWQVAGLFLLLFLLLACEPQDRRPGLWLQGDVAEAPVADWSFTDEVGEIFVETRTWYGIPHSVTTVCVAVGEHLYVPSVYGRTEEYPDARFWNRNVVRDPRVRLKIAGRIHELEARLVEDRGEWEAVFAAFARKSDYWRKLAAMPEAERPNLYFLRMTPRSEDP